MAVTFALSGESNGIPFSYDVAREDCIMVSNVHVGANLLKEEKEIELRDASYEFAKCDINLKYERGELVGSGVWLSHLWFYLVHPLTQQIPFNSFEGYPSRATLPFNMTDASNAFFEEGSLHIRVYVESFSPAVESEGWISNGQSPTYKLRVRDFILDSPPAVCSSIFDLHGDKWQLRLDPIKLANEQRGVRAAALSRITEALWTFNDSCQHQSIILDVNARDFSDLSRGYVDNGSITFYFKFIYNPVTKLNPTKSLSEEMRPGLGYKTHQEEYTSKASTSKGNCSLIPETNLETSPSRALEDLVPNRLIAGRYILKHWMDQRKKHVVVAEDTDSQSQNKDVVLKFYRSRSTFRNARKMHDLLDMTYVCKMLHVVDESGYPPCIVFERADDDLQECLKERKLVDTSEKDILKQILLCLEHIHSKGVVHCDLKPSNILFFVGTHSWKLSDMDIARLKNRRGSINYTPAYVAPEVLQAEEKGLMEIALSPATDMWSFGIIAFEVLSGMRFYGPEVTLEKVKDCLCNRRQPMPSLECIVEPQARRMIENCLHFDPSQRWSASRALNNALFQSAEDTTQKEAGVQKVVEKLDRIVNITLDTLHEVRSANLMANTCIEEFRSGDDQNIPFHQRAAKQAMMFKDDELVDPVFILRLNRSYRLRVSLKHRHSRKSIKYKILSVEVQPPDGIKKELRMVETSSASRQPEVIAYFCPNEHNSQRMETRSPNWGHVEAKYVKLSILMKLGTDRSTDDIQELIGHLYCQMVPLDYSLVGLRIINSAAELWSQCPQWIRTTARGAVILAKTVTPVAAAAAVGDPSGSLCCVRLARMCFCGAGTLQ